MRATRRRGARPLVLICTPEITELPEGMGNAANHVRAKGGGLGDISAALISYLYRDDRFELHVALPKYDTKIRDVSRISLREIDLLAPLLQRKGVHLVSDSAFSDLADIYDQNDAHPRVHRAEALQRFIINQLLDDLRPDVVHCNDWMTGLVPAAAREKGLKSLFTLHNVFTEYATPQAVDQSGINVRRFLPWLYFQRFPHASADNWGHNFVDFTASGIHAADIVNTVSPSFLEEIVGGTFEDIVPPSIRHAIREKHAAGRACGILNAPADTQDPRLSPHIVPYDIADVMDKKRLNKAALQQRLGLRADPEAPLFFWPSRLYPQKGPELLERVARHCTERYGAQIAMVANGAPDIERRFDALAAASGGRIALRRFREDLSELGKAGADFILMPSLYEPCGLPQMEGPRFGTLPVVRLTGGLRDSVLEIDTSAGTGNGFGFVDYDATAFEDAVGRAVTFYRLPAETRRLTLQRIMGESFEQFSLANTAKQYIEIYETLISQG